MSGLQTSSTQLASDARISGRREERRGDKERIKREDEEREKKKEKRKKAVVSRTGRDAAAGQKAHEEKTREKR